MAQQTSFGSGNLIAIPSGSNPTPAVFGVLQGIDLDISYALKELYGQNQSPVAIARAAQKITGKASFARINAALFNSLFFGGTIGSGTGGILEIISETGTIPAVSGPYTITVAQSANFLQDQGVFFAATGVQLTRVASGPTTGQYSVAAGVYTFAAADTLLGVLISYTYTGTTGASKITIGNPLMGSGPIFQINLAETFNSQVMNFQLNACTASKLAFPLKNQDFTVVNFEFEAYADASNVVGYITTTQ